MAQIKFSAGGTADHDLIRLICVLNAFGCAYATGCFKDQQYDVAGMNFMSPQLAEHKI